jgi:hypothetical protein
MNRITGYMIDFLAVLFLALFFTGAVCPRENENGTNAPDGRSGRILFQESFEDTDWIPRGWYDKPEMRITSEEHVPGSGHSCVWRWEKAGDVKPGGGGARARIEPVESVTLSFFMKHSINWEWTGVDWHPHEFHFLTTEDDSLVGPAYTHLTMYIEAVNGIPRVSIQDGRNIDEGRVGTDLVNITEHRSVAGGNGDSDGYGKGDCYPSGTVHWNGKSWKAGRKYFDDGPGPHDKTSWHHVKATLKLNSIKDGIGQRDGVIRYWFDGELIMDYRNVLFRTGAHPDMKINQFTMMPYYGPGVPHEQSIWVDEITITTDER